MEEKVFKPDTHIVTMTFLGNGRVLKDSLCGWMTGQVKRSTKLMQLERTQGYVRLDSLDSFCMKRAQWQDWAREKEDSSDM